MNKKLSSSALFAFVHLYGALGLSCVLAGGAIAAPQGVLEHQWTFNGGSTADSVGNATSALRGSSTILGDQLQIPTQGIVGLEFDTGKTIDLTAGLFNLLGGASFVVWLTPDDYLDQKYVMQIADKSFISLNANNGPYPRGGCGTSLSALVNQYSVTLTSKPGGLAGCQPNCREVMMVVTLKDNPVTGTDEASVELWESPTKLFEAASSQTLEFVTDLGGVNDVKLLGDDVQLRGSKNMTGSINEFRIYAGVLSKSQIAAIAAAGPTTFSADTSTISIASGGTQVLSLHAGPAQASRTYWIFGSATGTSPGIKLLGVDIPLNPDVYTDITIGLANTTPLTNFRGTLDASGTASASFIVPTGLPPAAFTLHHAYVVYDANGRFYMASNAVAVHLQ